MQFDFDTVYDNRDAHLSKWDYMQRACKVDVADGIPMWVADMNFRAAPAIREALGRELERGSFGYYGSPVSWLEAQRDWLRRRHGWEVEPDWISVLPGIMFGLHVVIERFSEPGDTVILFSPVYHEFAHRIEDNGRRVHNQPMLEEQGRYRMDVAGLAASLPPRARIVVLCSPQNPGGRVWSAEELREVADFCIANDLILVSDEIHNDLVYPGARHVPTAVAAPQAADRLVTLVGATKSFNLAGVKTGAVVVSDPALRRSIHAGIAASALGSPNRFGMIATEAAMRHGDAWLDALIPYLQANRDRFAQGIARAVPGARAMPLEATFLSWVDFSGTGLDDPEILDRIARRARVGVSPGAPFGPGGERRVRFNIGTQRHWIDTALARLSEAFSDL